MTKYYFVNASNGITDSGEVNINDWKEIYSILDCHTFDVTTVKLGNNLYSVYCDDDGLFKPRDELCWGAIKKHKFGIGDGIYYVPVLEGNLLVTNHETDDEGGDTDLTDEMILDIWMHLKKYDDPNTGETHDVLLVND